MKAAVVQVVTMRDYSSSSRSNRAKRRHSATARTDREGPRSLMPGVPNAVDGAAGGAAGFDAVYISGAGLANCHRGRAGYRIAHADRSRAAGRVTSRTR